MHIHFDDGDVEWTGEQWETEADPGTMACLASRYLNITASAYGNHDVVMLVNHAEEVAELAGGEVIDAPELKHDPNVMY